MRTAQKAETTKYNFAKLYEMKLSKAETLIYLEVSNLTNKAIECWTHAQHPKNLNQFKLSIEIRSNFVIVNRLTHIMWEYLEFNEDFPDGTLLQLFLFIYNLLNTMQRRNLDCSKLFSFFIKFHI